MEQEPDNQEYQPGLKVLELGMAKLQQIDLVREATPYLKELVNQGNETAHLGSFREGRCSLLIRNYGRKEWVNE